MKNKVQSGHTITVSKGSAAVSGEAYDIGNGYAGVAVADYGSADAGEYETSGVKSFGKDGSAYTVGELVGYDADTSSVVKSGDGAKDFDLGRVTAPADAGATSIEVMINDRQGPGPSYN